MFDLSKEIPLSHLELDKFIIDLYQNKILRIQIKQDKIVVLNDLSLVLSYIDSWKQGPYLNLFVFHKYSNTDDEVRNWASDPNGNKNTIADAIVIKGGLDQKLLSNAYMKFHNPVKPTCVFDNENKAVEWLLKQN